MAHLAIETVVFLAGGVIGWGITELRVRKALKEDSRRLDELFVKLELLETAICKTLEDILSRGRRQ